MAVSSEKTWVKHITEDKKKNLGWELGSLHCLLIEWRQIWQKLAVSCKNGTGFKRTKCLDKYSIQCHQRGSFENDITQYHSCIFPKKIIKYKHAFLSHLCYIGVQFPWHTSCRSPIVCELSLCSHCPEATSPATGKLHGDYPPKTGLKDNQTEEATSWYCHNHTSWFFQWVWRIKFL